MSAYDACMADRTDNLTSENLLGIPPTLLPDDFVDVEVSAELAEDQDPRDLAGIHPESPMVWATLAQTRSPKGRRRGLRSPAPATTAA